MSWLRQLSIEPGDLDLPVYYDLEEWVWTGHQPPTDPAIYEQMVHAWMEEVQGAGYTNASVYSYRSYLYGPLNSSYIHQHTSWAAEYGPNLGFTDLATTSAAGSTRARAAWRALPETSTSTPLATPRG